MRLEACSWLEFPKLQSISSFHNSQTQHNSFFWIYKGKMSGDFKPPAFPKSTKKQSTHKYTRVCVSYSRI